MELAREHEAHLTGVTIVDLDRLQKVGPVPLGGAAYAKKMAQRRIAVTQERVEEAVSGFQMACEDSGIACTVERETGDPLDLMISHARYHDLTIFGLRSLFDYGITNEPKDALIRLVSQGVRPILAVSTQYRTVAKALVAFSGSMESAKAMRRFVQMRLWPGVTIEIAHFGSDAVNGKALLTAASQYCQAHGYDTEVTFLEDNPDNGILAHAQRCEADIVVMGNSVKNLMLRQIIGGTALSTIQNADRPLFLAQ